LTARISPPYNSGNNSKHDNATGRQAGKDNTMSKFVITSEEQARAIISAYNKCSGCGECPLHNAEGWHCSYLFECACRYLKILH
jgi:hypothetical protein